MGPDWWLWLGAMGLVDGLESGLDVRAGYGYDAFGLGFGTTPKSSSGWNGSRARPAWAGASLSAGGGSTASISPLIWGTRREYTTAVPLDIPSALS